MEVIGWKIAQKLSDLYNLFLFKKPKYSQFFLEYINKKHDNMTFSIETEINGSLSFLDVIIFWENNKFLTSIFGKDTFSGEDTNFKFHLLYFTWVQDWFGTHLIESLF